MEKIQIKRRFLLKQWGYKFKILILLIQYPIFKFFEYL